MLLPELTERAADLAERIAGRLSGLAPVRVPVHGDFSADQAVLGPDGVAGLIDLDSAALGDPAADLGCAEAAMIAGVLLGQLTDGWPPYTPATPTQAAPPSPSGSGCTWPHTCYD